MLRILLVLFTFIGIAHAKYDEDLDCENANLYYSDEQKDVCIRTSMALRLNAAGADCAQCLEAKRSSGMEALGILAQPVAMVLSTYLGARYSYESNKLYANAMTNGYNQCTARYNSYLQYNTSRGANPITTYDGANCGVGGMGGYAGYGYGGYGYGGFGNLGSANLSAGFSSPFLGMMMGPYMGAGAGIGINAGINAGFSTGVGLGVPSLYANGGLNTGVGLGLPSLYANGGLNTGVGLGVPSLYANGGLNTGVGLGIPSMYANGGLNMGLPGVYANGNLNLGLPGMAANAYYGPSGTIGYNPNGNVSLISGGGIGGGVGAQLPYMVGGNGNGIGIFTGAAGLGNGSLYGNGIGNGYYGAGGNSGAYGVGGMEAAYYAQQQQQAQMAMAYQGSQMTISDRMSGNLATNNQAMNSLYRNYNSAGADLSLQGQFAGSAGVTAGAFGMAGIGAQMSYSTQTSPVFRM